MKQILDLTLQKYLGEGSFGKVYLSTKKGKKGVFATKLIDRKKIDAQEIYRKLLSDEIKLLKIFNHPNIIKLEEYKETKDLYIITMEYANGGNLDEYLEKYKKINKKCLSEEIIQYLMRQIIDALYYIHQKKVIHRDLKLENIMLNYNNEIDRQNLNILKSQIKIIDFGTAIQAETARTIVGTAPYMDPNILKNRNNTKDGIRLKEEYSYDDKADIWSIGTACYEMLMGKVVLNSYDFNYILKEIEKGLYKIPKTISKELSSFLNSMLQPDPSKRLNLEQLQKHPFLRKRVNEFINVDTKTILKTIKKEKIVNKQNINIKDNKSIWPIINASIEYIVLNIKAGREIQDPLKEVDDSTSFKRANTEKFRNIPQMFNQNPQQYNNSYISQSQGSEINRKNTFTPQNIYMNNSNLPYNQYQQMNYGNNISINQKSMINISYPGNSMQLQYGNINSNNMPNYGNNNQMGGNIYNNSEILDSNFKSKIEHYRPIDNDDSDNKNCILI